MSSKTTGSVVDVLDRVIGLAAPSSSSNGGNGGGPSSNAGPQFIASKKFQGPKSGYVFRTSEQYGTGYHLDRNIVSNTNNGNTTNVDDTNNNATDSGGIIDNKKRARFDASHNTTHTIPSRPIKQSKKKVLPTGDELLAQAESQVSTKVLELTPRGIQTASQSLNKTYQRNSLLRAQHSHDASKFMYNEITLNDEITSFKSTAVNVTLYNKLVDCGTMNMFLGLMSHDNSDVVISVVNVLVELFDPDVLVQQQQQQDDDDDDYDKTNQPVTEPEENMRILVNSFVNGGGLDLLSSNLGRFDESVDEDAKGIEDVLTLVESILDLERSGVLQRDVPSDNDDQEEGGEEDVGSIKSSMSIVACICQQTALLSWLFQRIDKGDNDSSNERQATSTASAPISPALLKLHASEVLSTILQHEDYSMSRCGSRLAMLPKYTSAFDDDDDDDEAAAKPKDGEQSNDAKKDKKEDTTLIDGMEVLLLAIAGYRKSDPRVEVECEFLENVFDALAASLLREDNVLDFVKAEGIELMLRCIRQKVHAGGGALKVLNFALSGSAARREDGDDDDNNSNDNNALRQACETFVHAGGLKLLFPLYMLRKSAIPCPATCSEASSKLVKKKDNKNGGAAVLSKRAKRAAHARKKWLVEVEHNAINIMYALTMHIVKESKYDAHARLLVKFVEEDCEKCDRTIELCLKYDEKARIAEYQYFRSDDAEEAERMGIDVEFAALAAKLRGGGDVFHRSCAILSFAIVGSKRCRGHVMDQLKLQGSGMSVIKVGLTEFASLLSDNSQKAQIENYITEI